MKISEIAKFLEEYAPVSLAEDFDNVGLLLGYGESEVTRILLTLDVDYNVAVEAKALGAELIVSHHPVIFNPLKKITDETQEGRCLLYLIKNGISVYSAHTNLDSAAGGLNDLLSELLGLQSTVPLCDNGSGEGLGRIGTLKDTATMSGLASKVKSILSVPLIRCSGKPDDIVSKVALCTGGGGSLVEDAIKSGADVYISGDIKYNEARSAFAAGLNIIEVGHYETEIIVMQLFESIISDAAGNLIELFRSKSNKNVFSQII